MVISHRLTVITGATGLWFGVRARRNLAALPALSTERHTAGHVTIVVPARNERDRIGPLLVSLQALEYDDYSVVVVDDGSTDGTADLAHGAGFTVITIKGPAPGWTGKAHACWIGAQAADGEWILFTDADTEHAPASLSRAVAHAVSADVQLFSVLPRQKCDSFWERLLLPYTYALYFAGASRVNRAGGPSVANGQYMLFRRSAYWAIGGHACVRDSIIEDVALARAMARSGRTVTLARADTAVSVRMYQSLPDIWEGFSKNAVRFIRVSPRTGIPTALAGLAWASALPHALRYRNRWCLLALAVPAACLLPWEDEFRVPRAYALLYPLAAAVFQVLALDSLRRTLKRGGTVWKGRLY